MPDDKIVKPLNRVRQEAYVTFVAVYVLRDHFINNCKPHATEHLGTFEHILTVGHLQELPLTLFGSREPTAHLHLYMDASNLGLEIPLDFEEITWINCEPKTSKFSIEVPEYFCIALAFWVWGPSWLRPKHTVIVKCWSDTQAAVTWSNSLSSSNEWIHEIKQINRPCGGKIQRASGCRSFGWINKLCGGRCISGMGVTRFRDLD
ncbi:hypothetical protein PHMEG_00014698 [Phytophthora megakarya]|uniref:Uncharacterized protein n=1 Tax=Phytophthora megakarya TaxID=4795 RepID=A0A225W4Q3_9STRA|nr:hypothetical protein PHMEG_00014698 [Phytophthora megakarya]